MANRHVGTPLRLQDARAGRIGRRELTELSESEGLLSGFKVLDLSSGVAGPYATRLMASMGADVIKVEPPEGEESRREGPFPDDEPHPERSALFLYLNVGKRGVTLDLDTPTGRKMLLLLASWADVLVESYQPSRAAELGLTYEALQEANPALVMTSVTDFGQTGPYKDHNARTLNHYAYGGLMYITGRPEKEPLQMGPRVPEYGTGQNAFVATLSALWHRESTGEGQHVDISVAEYSASILENALTMYSYTRHKVTRMGHRGYGRAAWGMYPCKDGYVGVIAGPAHRWPAMAELMEEPRLNDERFSTARGRQVYADELGGAHGALAHAQQQARDFREGAEHGHRLRIRSRPRRDSLLGAPARPRLLCRDRPPRGRDSGLRRSALPARRYTVQLDAGPAARRA